ncbi:hypothetical protein GCM10023322_75600 [Rugosimonospora acidiphila]|uniref:Uncharacterized protein n=1 Tax=Rugosimonospora acidiphila TaxID=556531 RepID=A0ABP9SNB9_9ACTN
MIDEQVLSAIAVAVSTKAVEGLAEGGKATFATLVRLIRRRFQSKASAREALGTAEVSPGDAARVATLRAELARVIAEDPDFEAELREIWRGLGPYLNGARAEVTNRVVGDVSGSVVQARDVHGGIAIGAPGRQAPGGRSLSG